VTAAAAPLDPLLTVVMPAFNEELILAESVHDVCTGLRARGSNFEVLVVENGSTDDTRQVAAALLARHPEVRVESLSRADYGAALRHGLLAARGTVIVNFDTDYYDLDFLDAAVDQVLAEGGPAIVVGSKRAPGSDDNRAALRRLVTFVFSGILKVGFGLKVSDTHGMKAMRRADVVGHARECKLGRDLFDTELILRTERAGRITGEIPVAVEERRPARTSIVRRVPRTLTGLVRLRLALRGTHR
jgi:glycosyltransferase AglD